jgi:hypothetical protein
MDDRAGLGEKKSTPKEMNCNLKKVIDHIDHICQMRVIHFMLASVPILMADTAGAMSL